MKKVKSYSAQFQIIPQNEKTKSTRSASGAFGNIPSNDNYNPNGVSNENNTKKKKLSKQNQKFKNNISACGFKQFFS